jgi:hypothetical protein
MELGPELFVEYHTRMSPTGIFRGHMSIIAKLITNCWHGLPGDSEQPVPRVAVNQSGVGHSGPSYFLTSCCPTFA